MSDNIQSRFTIRLSLRINYKFINLILWRILFSSNILILWRELLLFNSLILWRDCFLLIAWSCVDDYFPLKHTVMCITMVLCSNNLYQGFSAYWKFKKPKWAYDGSIKFHISNIKNSIIEDLGSFCDLMCLSDW